MTIINQLTPEIAKYALCAIFVISGLAKIADKNSMIKTFPRLPTNFWLPAAIWEIAAAAAVWFGRIHIGCLLSYAFLGGVFYATLILKNLEGKTMVGKTFGLIMIPGALTFVSALTLAETIKQPVVYAVGAALFGVIAGHLIAQRKIKL